MAKKLSMLLMLAVLSAGLLSAHTYTDKSVLASGRFVKISVENTGIYKLTYSELADMGLKPENVRIYGYGGGVLEKDFRKAKIDDLPAVPFYMHKGADGVFDKSDYILFYAQGPISWSHDGTRFVHKQNTYSLLGYYFLSDDAGEQKLLTPAEAGEFTSNAFSVDRFTCVQVFDVDSLNVVDPMGGGEGGGKEFYYPLKATAPTKIINFPFPNIITSEPISCVLDVAASAPTRSSFTCSIGSSSHNIFVGAMSSNDKYEKAVAGKSSFRLQPASGDVQQVKITYNTTSSSAMGYVNYLELSAVCDMKMSGSSMKMASVEHLNSSRPSVFNLSEANENIQVWNITDLSNIYSVPTRREGSTLRFEVDNAILQTVVAVDVTADFPHPVYVSEVKNQNLHGLEGAEFVIISPSAFVAEAERLAMAHEEYDGLSWTVVTDEQVYNEFSSGTPDATAYRWVMKMMYDRANTTGSVAPRYLLLMGDGSYDNRGIIPASSPHTLLTYQADNSVNEVKAYSTDDYFAFLDDIEGVSDITARMDIGVGRLPVNTVDEARDVVNKILRYMENQSFGKWKSQLVFLADDGDSGLHTTIADYAAENIRTSAPNFVTNKIYIDAYQQEVSASGESYPLAKTKFDNLLNNGVLFFDYSGHGGYNNIASEAMLTASEIRNMNNDNLAFWMLATCGFANYDARKTSASEYAVLNPHGGALAVLSACRTVFASNNKIINRHLCDSLLLGDTENTRLGDAVRKAKNRTGSEENKLAFILLGDPALRLNYPNKYNVVTTSELDTLRALSMHTIEGMITDAGGEKVADFNGKLQLTIYDKMQVQKTLDNDHTTESEKVFFEYNDYPTTIFSGEVDVTEGNFKAQFMVPLDIRYNFGNGRVVYYAYDSQTSDEAIGSFHKLVIGGSSSVDFSDEEGPEMNIYLNTPYFADGDITSTSPHFYADLSDANGINTSGSGVGHDLMLVVDNDIKQTYVLNGHFTSLPNNFRAGSVSYPLSNLKEGRHELMFRAWDLLNNSTTKTLRFQVSDTYSMAVRRVLMYPNPASVGETVHFVVEHDQPDQRINMTLDVFDVAGRLMMSRTVESVGAESIDLNLAEYGVAAGVYMYRLTLTDQDSTVVKKAGKLIVR